MASRYLVGLSGKSWIEKELEGFFYFWVFFKPIFRETSSLLAQKTLWGGSTPAQDRGCSQASLPGAEHLLISAPPFAFHSSASIKGSTIRRCLPRQRCKANHCFWRDFDAQFLRAQIKPRLTLGGIHLWRHFLKSMVIFCEVSETFNSLSLW